MGENDHRKEKKTASTREGCPYVWSQRLEDVVESRGGGKRGGFLS